MLPLAEDTLGSEGIAEVHNEARNAESTNAEATSKEVTYQEVITGEGSEIPVAGAEAASADPAPQVATKEAPAPNVDNAAGKAANKDDEDSMASSSERMAILRMIEQGKISAEDGARLLNALGDRQDAQSQARPIAFDAARHLQIRVTDLATNRNKVNVTLPVSLVQMVWRWLPASAKAQFEAVEAAIAAGSVGQLVEVVDQESNVRVDITVI